MATITMPTKGRHPEKIYVSFTYGGPAVLEVVDRGPGIPKKVAEQIFDPFFTTHEHGTGLGLYIARELCEANQATLEFVPVAGGGSCFRIGMSAPATIAAGSSPAAARARAAVPSPGRSG